MDNRTSTLQVITLDTKVQVDAGEIGIDFRDTVPETETRALSNRRSESSARRWDSSYTDVCVP